MAPGSGTGLHMDLLLTGCPCVPVSLYVTECTSDCVCVCVSVLCARTSQTLGRYKLGYTFVAWSRLLSQQIK